MSNRDNAADFNKLWKSLMGNRPLTDTEITTVSGSVSGVAATFAKQPIQRLKWIRQVGEGKPIPHRQVLLETFQKTGVRGFFAGSMAAIYRNVPHSTLTYTLYPHAEKQVLAVQRSLWPTKELRPKDFSTRFWAGYVTLFVSTLITHPLDTVRVFPETAKVGVFRAANDMYMKEGVSSFYRGFGTTLVGAGPRGAVGFGIFETLKPACKTVPFLKDHDTASKLLCGYLAGFSSEAAIYPLDTVRRRQQALGDQAGIGRRGLASAITHIVRHEGILGLYKGLMLNMLKNPLSVAVSFAINDMVKDSMGYGKQHQSA